MSSDYTPLQPASPTIDDYLSSLPDSSPLPASSTPRPALANPPKDYRDAANFAKQNNFYVTATTGGLHNNNSAHYQGRAVDLRTRDKSPDEVNQMMAKAQQSGYTVRDERVRPSGQQVWSGPHIHLEIPQNLTGRPFVMARPKAAQKVQPQSASPTIDDILSGGSNAADSSNPGGSVVNNGSGDNRPQNQSLAPQTDAGVNEVAAGPALSASSGEMAISPGNAPGSTLEGFNTIRSRTVTPPFNERDFRQYLNTMRIPITQANLQKLRPAFQAMQMGDTDATDKFLAIPESVPARQVQQGRPGQSYNISPYDAAWHMAITPDEFRNLTPRAARVIQRAVIEDQRKRAAGQDISPPDLAYQNSERAKAGLAPRKYNLPIGQTGYEGNAPYYKPEPGSLAGITPKVFGPQRLNPGVGINTNQINAQMQPFSPNMPFKASQQDAELAQIRQQVQDEQAQVGQMAGADQGPQGIAQRRPSTMSPEDINAEANRRYQDLQDQRAAAVKYRDQYNQSGIEQNIDPQLRTLAVRPLLNWAAASSTAAKNLLEIPKGVNRAWDFLLNKTGIAPGSNTADYLWGGVQRNLAQNAEDLSGLSSADRQALRENSKGGVNNVLSDVVEGGATMSLDLMTNFKMASSLLGTTAGAIAAKRALRMGLDPGQTAGMVAEATRAAEHPSNVMALVSGIQSADKGVVKQAFETAKGYGMGRALTATEGIGRVKSGLVQGLGAGALTLAETGDPRQAASQATLMGTMGYMTGEKPESEPTQDQAIRARADAIASGLSNEGQPIRVVKGQPSSDAQIEQIRQAERERRAQEPVHYSNLQPRDSEGKFNGPPVADNVPAVDSSGVGGQRESEPAVGESNVPQEPVDANVGQPIVNPGEQTQEPSPESVSGREPNVPLSREALPDGVALRSPIKGDNGNQIIGYNWKSRLGEKYSEYEGGMVNARVSDWENPSESKGTGRKIVHEYYVQHPDGSITVEGIRSAQNILGISETRLQTIAKNERAARELQQQNEDKTAKSIESRAFDSPDEAARQWRKLNYSPLVPFETSQERFNASTSLEKDGKFLRVSGDTARLMQSRGWKPVETSAAKAEPSATVDSSSKTNTPVLKGEKTNVNQEQVGGFTTESGAGSAKAPAPVTIDDILSKETSDATNSRFDEKSASDKLQGVRNGADVSTHPEQVREGESGQAANRGGAARGSEVKEPDGSLQAKGEIDANNTRINEENGSKGIAPKGNETAAANEQSADESTATSRSNAATDAAEQSNGQLPSKTIDDLLSEKPTPTSARKASLAEDAAELGLEELPPAERKSWQTSLQNAKDKNLDAGAEKLADRILKKPRAMTDEETAGMVLRLQQLKNQHAELFKDIQDEKNPEAIGEKSDRLREIEAEFDKLRTATKASGTEKGRNLASQKLTIDRNYDLISMLNRAKVEKGDSLTPDERSKFEEISKKLEDVQRRMDLAEKRTAEQNEEIQKLKAQRAVDALANSRETRQARRSAKKTDLDAEFADLKAGLFAAYAKVKDTSGIQPSLFARLDPEGDISKALIKLAANRVKAGVNSVEGVVDSIYSEIKDTFDGVTKRDIRDVLAGADKGPTKTKSQLQTDLNEVRKQARIVNAIEDAESGQAPTKSNRGKAQQSARVQELRKQLADTLKEQGLVTERGPRDPLPAIKTRLTKQIADIQRQIETGDFSKPVKSKVVYDERANQLKAERDKLQAQADAEAAKLRTPTMGERIGWWQRMQILSGYHVLGKMAAAAAIGQPVTVANDVFGGLLSKVPGLRDIAAKAPREGGFSVQAQVDGLKQFVSKMTATDMLDKLKTGQTSFEREAREKPRGEMYNLFGNIHGALKVPAERAEFYRSLEMRTRHAIAQGNEPMAPDVQTNIIAGAMADAKRAILMQDNLAVSIYRGITNGLRSRGKAVGPAIATAMDTLLPIVKIPSNYAEETSSYIPGVGIAKGVTRLLHSNVSENGYKKTLGNILAGKAADALSPEDADYVMRAFKKQGLGAGLIAIGYALPQAFGGFYGANDKLKHGDLEPGEMKVAGVTIPHLLLHNPALEMLQLGATIAKVQGRYKDAGKNNGTLAGLGVGAKGLAEQVPFYEEISRGLRATETGSRAARFAGEYTRSFIPLSGLTQNLAADTDRDAEGTVKRKVAGFTDALKYGEPILREQLPNSRGPLYTALQNGKPENQPVLKELERLGLDYWHSTSSATMDEGEKRSSLSADQQQQLDAQTFKMMIPAIQKQMARPGYSTMSDDAKKEAIKSIIKDSRSDALDNFKGQQYKQRQAMRPSANQ
jgi:hypothetical protein